MFNNFNFTRISQNTFCNYKIALAVKLQYILGSFSLVSAAFSTLYNISLSDIYNTVCRDVLRSATAARAYSE